MRQVVSFDKLKLTNNELEDQGHVSAHLITVNVMLMSLYIHTLVFKAQFYFFLKKLIFIHCLIFNTLN